MIELNDFPVESVHLKGIYRNFRTRLPPEDTFSDLLDDEEEREILRKHTDAFSGIDLMEDQFNRPFQYAQAFPEIKKDEFFKSFLKGDSATFPMGRFGDGFAFGVLYCALEKETFEAEAIYYAVKEFNDRLKDLEEDCLTIDRKMICVDFQGELIDLTNEKPLYEKLISEDYSFCRKLGTLYHDRIGAFKTFSARKKEGNCLPVFDKNSIINFHHLDSFKYNFRIKIYKNNPDEVIIENILSRTIKQSEVLAGL